LAAVRSVAEAMQRGEDVTPKLFTDASVFFCDIVNFQIMAMESEPMEIVKLLNDIYVKFDEVIARFRVYKVRRAVTSNIIVIHCVQKKTPTCVSFDIFEEKF